jgi:hypothetical protein
MGKILQMFISCPINDADTETSNFPDLDSYQAALTPVHGVNATKVNPQLNHQRRGEGQNKTKQTNTLKLDME